MTDGRIEFHTHPEYNAKVDDWDLYRVLYEADRKKLVLSRYLWPHELEASQQEIARDPTTGVRETVGERLRRIRAQRSRYYNLFEPIVSNWIALAFSKPIRLDEATEKLLGEERNDIDGNGTSIENFITGPVATAYFRDGAPIIGVDAPENAARSRAEEITSGFRPFMEVLDVLSVKDWQLADVGPNAGRYDWLRHEYAAISPRISPQEKPEEVQYCRVYSLAEGGFGVVVEVFKYSKDSKDWTPVGDPRLLTGWTEIPISTLHGNEPWVKDVAELQLVLFNLMSAYYNQLNTQAFQRIFISGSQGEKNLISLSEYAISILADGSQVTVINPSDTSSLVDAINATVDQIYRVAFNRTRGQAADSKEAPGANTLREMQAELIALLVRAVTEIETVVNRALKHYAMFKLGPEAGAKFEGRITLSKDITVADVAQRIELFATYRDEIRKVLSWRKAELKRAASEMGYSENETEEILDEIDKLKDEPLLDPLSAMGPFAAKGQNNMPMNKQQPGDGQEEDQEADDEAG